MGACLSCLGLGPRQSDLENPETSRLLYDEPYRSHNIQNSHRPAYQPDPESLRREREALEGLCHSMSDEVVDIFTVLTPSLSEGTRSWNICAELVVTRPVYLNRSKSPISHTNGSNEAEMTNEESIYRTVRRGGVGRIASPLNQDERNWRATKAVIG